MKPRLLKINDKKALIDAAKVGGYETSHLGPIRERAIDGFMEMAHDRTDQRHGIAVGRDYWHHRSSRF